MWVIVVPAAQHQPIVIGPFSSEDRAYAYTRERFVGKPMFHVVRVDVTEERDR